MKKSALFGLLIMFCSLNMKAQTRNYPLNTIDINSAITATSLAMNRVFNGYDSLKYDVNAKTPFALSYSYKINNWFRIGATGSIQRYQVKFEEYIDETGYLRTGDFSATVKRNHLLLTPIVYKSMGRVELYGGLKMGIGFWKVKVDSDKLALNFINKVNGLTLPAGSAFAGTRFFLTENIGFNAELNLGPPYIASGGLTIGF